MAAVLIANCVHTPGDCTRAPSGPQGDFHQTTRGLPELRALLPTSCMQVLSPTFMAHLQRCFDGGGNFSCSYVFYLWRYVSPEIWSEITTVRWFYSNGILARNPKDASFKNERTVRLEFNLESSANTTNRTCLYMCSSTPSCLVLLQAKSR